MNNEIKGTFCMIIAISILLLSGFLAKTVIQHYVGLSIGIVFLILETYYYGILKLKEKHKVKK